MIFTLDDLAAFAAASRDVNPLHLNAEYARATAFGERVVYGGLVALRSLGYLPERRGQRLAKLSAEFRAPLFVGVAYSVSTERQGASSVVKVLDGRRLLLRLVAEFGEGCGVEESSPPPTHSEGEVREPSVLGIKDVSPGMLLRGWYAPDLVAVKRLLQPIDLPARGVAESQAIALLACSYLVGMRAPGREALFYSAKLDWTQSPADGEPGAYTAEIREIHQALGLMTVQVQFASPWRFSGELKSFIRQPVAQSHSIDAQVSSELWKDRIALVVGASRGLGAAISEALAMAGATVIGTYLHSENSINQLAGRLRTNGFAFDPVRVDAGDPAAMATLAEEIIQQYGGIDLLVCTACPPLHALSIDLASRDRVLKHISDSVGMVFTPLSCTLDALRMRRGVALLLSSSAVETRPPEWPHYIAAKRAIEGLAAAAAAAHKEVQIWIARPPKLLTELINTPLGRQGALDPGLYATGVVAAMAGSKEAPDLGLSIVNPVGR